MAFIKKFFGLLKNKKYLYGAIAVVIFLLVIFFFKNGKETANFITVSHSDFINKVSVSGNVIASQEVDLGFKNGGRIVGVFYGVGGTNIIKSGTIIAKLDTKDAEQVVRDAEIGLESAKLALAKTKLKNSNEKLSIDLQKAYDDGFTKVSDSLFDFSSIILNLNDILTQDNLSNNAARMSGTTAEDFRDKSEELYYDAKTAFEKNRKEFRLLDRNSSKDKIENIINEVYDTSKIFSDAIKNTKNLVDYLSDDSSSPSDFDLSKKTLSDYSSIINKHLADLLSVKNNIKNYKDEFPSTDLELRDAELSVKRKESDLLNAKNELADYFIKAPFDGIITKVDAKVGEITSSDKSLVTMMSDDIFQIESYVPEVNIADIKVGDSASVTLDAYGEGAVFQAKVISIDPAETIKDGVSTYKTKLEFDSLDDRIKSGMTASVSVITFSKPNVIVIPSGVVFEKDGKSFVQLKGQKGEIIDREVTPGLVSSLGQVEVVSGLSDGEMIVLNPKLK